jgi:lipopolysaccharide export system permease protein
MLVIVDSLKTIRDRYNITYNKQVQKYFFGDSSAVPFKNVIQHAATEGGISQGIIEKVRSTKNMILSENMRVDYQQKEINKYMVEVHKKYSLPAACLIFVLLGAPLGVMVRKGGFGMAASISLFFFLIYWASLIGGEKLADRAIITPFWGMWFANAFMGLMGIVLTYRVAKESITLDFSFIQKLVPKNWRQEENKNENS